MLAIISKMTLTQVRAETPGAKRAPLFEQHLTIFPHQVSCWFANARRRLKKENKMTWEPKNGLNDEDVDVSDEEEGDLFEEPFWAEFAGKIQSSVDGGTLLRARRWSRGTMSGS